MLEVYNQSNLLKLHYDFRCHFLPVGMLSNGNRQLSYHTWSLAHTLYLDILSCSEVLSLASSLSNLIFFIWLRFVIVSLYWFPYIDLLNYRSKKLGPALKFVRCTCVLPSVLILWPMAGIVRSVIGGAAYGFFAPIFATFEAVEGGKENKLFHCFIVCFIFVGIKILVIFVLLLLLNTEFHILSLGWNMEHH